VKRFQIALSLRGAYTLYKNVGGLWSCADLRKRFEQEPINSHVEATATVQLQCLPPSGLPAPQVGLLDTAHYVVGLSVRSSVAKVLNTTFCKRMYRF